MALRGCPQLEVIAIGFCRCECANGLPDTTSKAPTKDAQESWSNRGGENQDNAEDLSAGDGDRCSTLVLRPKVISEDVGDDEEGGLEHEGECLDEESENPG